MGLATRLGAGKGRKNGTVKALMPSCYTGRQEGIRANLQGIDGRSQMQSAFPCLVHANAHDSWQCSTFEGQICSLRKSFTSIGCKTATDSRFRDVGMCAQDCSHDCGAVNLTCTTTAETWECSTSSSKANMLAKPTALG